MDLKRHVYALGIVAHPDDETFLFAGTCLKLAEEGKSTAVICATKGEKGADRLNRNLTRKQMTTERVSELNKAAKIIKLKKVEFFDYSDGGLENTDFKKLAKKLAEKINQYAPQIVLTFGPEGISGHKDHTVMGLATLAAIRLANHKPKEAWLASMPSSKIKEFNDHLDRRRVHHSHFHKIKLKGVLDRKLKDLDISKYSKIKMRAIKAHKSQFAPHLILKNFLYHEYFQVVTINH